MTIPHYLQPDPTWTEAKRRLWTLTPHERVVAMRTGRLSLKLCAHWASVAPHEVPTLDGEWEFIARHTPEVADARETARVPC